MAVGDTRIVHAPSHWRHALTNDTFVDVGADGYACMQFIAHLNNDGWVVIECLSNTGKVAEFLALRGV